MTFERLLNAAAEPQNWLSYSGSYLSQRHSALKQIRPSNVGELELKWVFQAQSLESFETTPLVVDGVMYLTEAPDTAVALDAATGRLFWRYQHNPDAAARPCCGRVNRGLAILGDHVFMATIDAKLIALDVKTGQPAWQIDVADASKGYAMTLAPLVIKNKVIVGVAGGEYGIRGFIAAYDAATGDEAWRFYTIPGPGEPGHETWADGGDAWQHGGASVWVTGSYDPALDLTYWGIGNPGPDWNPAQRPGDNLYSDSVVALDPDTGELKWHFQFTPNDDYDYDAVQVPVLVDLPTRDANERQVDAMGQPQRLLLRARPHDGRVRPRQPVRERELGERPRRARPADRDAAGPGARSRTRACRAARTGTRRRTARAPSSSMFPRGRTTARCSSPRTRSISRASASSAGSRAARSRASRTCRAFAAARSTTGRRRSATAP